MTRSADIALEGISRRRAAREGEGWASIDAAILSACHPMQRDLVRDPGRRVAALVGRGGGKTTAVRARFVRRMASTHKAKCLYIATTRDQAIDLLWNPLKDIVERLRIPAKYNETSLRCEFLETGSTLRLAGADDKRQIEKYRGLPFHEVWIDEAASYPLKLLEHLIIRIIGPRLGDYGGMLGLVGTPGHVLAGEFYDATRPGSPANRRWEDRRKEEFLGWKSWSLHTWTLQDGAPHVPAMDRLWAEALVEKEARGWSDKHPVWLREYCGQWAADDTDHVYRYRPHDDEGNPLNQWDPVVDPVTRFAVLPDDFDEPRYVYAADFGHTDPTAINVFAYSLSDDEQRLFHVFCFSAREMYPKKISELLIGEDPKDGSEWPNHDKPGGCIGVTGWPAGFVADPQGLARGYIAEFGRVYGIQIKLADQRAKFDSIEMTNGDLIDGKIKIMKGSELEEQLLNLQWIADDYGKVKEDARQRNDHCDTLIYARRESQHLIGTDTPLNEPGNYSPYDDSEFDADGGNSEFDGLLGDGGFFG